MATQTAESREIEPQIAEPSGVEYATLLERVAGFIIDNLVLGVALLGVAILPETLAVVYFLAWVLFVLFYIFILEGIWTNQTAGKYVMKMHVAKDDGSPAGILDAVVRNVIGVFGQAFGWLGLLVGAFAIWQSERNKRLGDSAAGTIVVKNQGTQVRDRGA